MLPIQRAAGAGVTCSAVSRFRLRHLSFVRIREMSKAIYRRWRTEEAVQKKREKKRRSILLKNDL